MSFYRMTIVRKELPRDDYTYDPILARTEDYETEARQKRLREAQEFNRAWFWCGLTGTVLLSALAWWGIVKLFVWAHHLLN
jgi:hypothetical protein